MPEEEIKEFTNPDKWLTYFPAYGKSDLQKFGLGVDWRRSFITTAHNKYYDAFIRWQFNILHKKSKTAFGKRPAIFSITSNNVCADHDRQEGEGVNPQEYTLIKI